MKQMLEAITRKYEMPALQEGKPFRVVITPNTVEKPVTVPANSQQSGMCIGGEYSITVKKYMTQHASPSFDFMSRFNGDNPMPLVEMVGKVTKETRGMVYMELHGIYKTNSTTCMHCGRPLTHPVSMLYGIGPECGKHAYINPMGSEEELEAFVEQARQKIVSTTWNGWVIKSAITDWQGAQ